jgi:hypothetical protein
MADFIITTNENYFIGVTGDSRRYCPIPLNPKYIGIQTEEIRKYFDKISSCPTEAFAKILFNRDLSGFNPRQFKKTELFQTQVEKSWESPVRWLYQVLESGHIAQAGASKTINWNKLPPSEQSDNDWEIYGNQKTGDCFEGHLSKMAFIKDGVRWYRFSKLYEIYSRAGLGAYSKTTTEQVFRQTIKEVLGDTMKTKSHPRLGMCVNLPELDLARETFNKWSKWDYPWGGDEGEFQEGEMDDINFSEEW